MATQPKAKTISIWNPQIVQRAIWDSMKKLHPRTMARNPVMFVVEIGSVLTTLRLIQDGLAGRSGLGFEFQITFWLWLTVLFANFAEAMAEGRGKAQADTLRKAKTETMANRESPDGSLVRVGALTPGGGLRFCLPQRLGLRLAPAFGHRLGEVGEEHGEPQPQGDEAGEHVLVGGGGPEVPDEEDGGEHRPDLDHEHDRVADHGAGVQLDEAVLDRLARDARVEELAAAGSAPP